jgi:hypothetical protein
LNDYKITRINASYGIITSTITADYDLKRTNAGGTSSVVVYSHTGGDKAYSQSVTPFTVNTDDTLWLDVRDAPDAEAKGYTITITLTV